MYKGCGHTHAKGGREMCTNGAVIHKVNAWWRGCNGAHQKASDVRISGTVRVRKRRVIDRGQG